MSLTPYLGIEIGGTKLQLGVGPGDGNLAGFWRGAVEASAGAEGIRRQLVAVIPELLERVGVRRDRVGGAGIGFGGPVDDRTRRVIQSHQISGWDDFPLAEWAERELSCPCVVGNDADVAGLAEARFGAGKGLSPIFYVTIGSGIGGGLIVHGEIYRGCGRGAAELGHLRVAGPAGPMPLEDLASGWAIARTARARGLDCASAAEVAQRALAGDPTALAVLDDARTALADALSQMITLLCPRRIILGGGVALMGEALLFDPLRQAVAARVFAPFAHCYDIVPAALGEEVVVHGALALARQPH